VALVVKYADNLLKGFALSLAIVFSALISTILFNFQLTWEFVLGTFLVSISIFMYGCQPPAWLSSKVKLNFARSNSYKRKSSPRPAEKAPIVEQE
jgi:UDP-sugar transporter A1/2/3